MHKARKRILGLLVAILALIGLNGLAGGNASAKVLAANLAITDTTRQIGGPSYIDSYAGYECSDTTPYNGSSVKVCVYEYAELTPCDDAGHFGTGDSCITYPPPYSSASDSMVTIWAKFRAYCYSTSTGNEVNCNNFSASLGGHSNGATSPAGANGSYTLCGGAGNSPVCPSPGTHIDSGNYMKIGHGYQNVGGTCHDFGGLFYPFVGSSSVPIIYGASNHNTGQGLTFTPYPTLQTSLSVNQPYTC